MTSKTLIAILSFCALSLIGPAVLSAQTAAPSASSPQAATANNPWAYSASLAVKETFDSNVFLQDRGDQAKRKSWVTSLLPSAGVTYQQSPAFKASLSYSPEVTFYHSERSEDYTAHRGAFNVGSTVNKTSWEILNGVVWIDGDHLGPRFTGGGAIPALGGIALRDRRDAAIYRNSFKLTHAMGDWFLRPTFNAYVHDFQTEQHDPTGLFAGYENYIDRYELGGGADVGYQIAEKTWMVMGYRFGHQEQGKLLGSPSKYSNNYHRFLVGIEGTPTEWLKLHVMAGPDVRDYGSAVPSTFNKNELIYYLDASVSLMPSKRDTITLAARRYQQPAFSSHSVYEDIVYDLTYRRKLCTKVTAGAGFRLYEGDWQAPANREDWIFTPSAMLTYTHNKHLSGELAYSYDWVDSKVPDTTNREFTRHLVSLGVKYAF